MISSIVLAAGMSTRMGQPKALLDWGGEPLIAYQVKQLREAGVDEVIVVLGHQADAIHRKMKGLACRVMLNPRYHAGRAGSLRIGAKAVNRDAEAIVVMSVDQPRPAGLLRQLIQAHTAAAAATRPAFGGAHGHPVIVAGRLRSEMMGAREETEGLAGVLRAHAAELRDVPCDDLCQLDINTPEDYEAARRRFGVLS
jgi:CTP:molybdopterin cytidylyltransferase MocA